MKILKQYLSSCFPSYFPSKSDTLYSNYISNSMSSIWGTQSDIGNIPIVNIAQTTFNTQPKGSGSLSPQGDGVDNLFLINKPSTYNKMLESFINHNGPNSDKVKDLISPEIDLADRAYNIHIITGSNTHNQLFLHNTLKNKSSLSKILDNSLDSPISIESTSTSVSEIDLSMIGIDKILLDYGEGARIALDLFNT